MVNNKNIDERSVNEHIQFLTDTAVLTRSKKINPRKSYCSEFLEKVKIAIDIDKTKEVDYTTKSKKVEYERYE